MEHTIVTQHYTTEYGHVKYERVEVDTTTSKIYQYKYYGKYIESTRQLNQIIDKLVRNGFMADVFHRGLDDVYVFRCSTNPDKYYEYSGVDGYMYSVSRVQVGEMR
jgi:hypothetical protein